jgi:hypothetical protein
MKKLTSNELASNEVTSNEPTLNELNNKNQPMHFKI